MGPCLIRGRSGHKVSWQKKTQNRYLIRSEERFWPWRPSLNYKAGSNANWSCSTEKSKDFSVSEPLKCGCVFRHRIMTMCLKSCHKIRYFSRFIGIAHLLSASLSQKGLFRFIWWSCTKGKVCVVSVASGIIPAYIHFIPMNPAVPSERKWDWGSIYFHPEGDLYLLRQCSDP